MFHNRRVLGAIRTPFVAAGGGGDPSVIFGSNLKGWWAADNTNPKTDKSALGFNIEYYGTTAPTVDATGINTHPAWKFLNTGGGTGAISGSAGGFSVLAYPALGGAGGVFMVVKADAAASTTTRFVSMDVGPSSDDITSLNTWTGYLGNVSTELNVGCNGTFTANTGSYATSLEACIISYVLTSTSISVYKNNVLLGSISPGTINIGGGAGAGFTTLIFGNNQFGASPMAGWIGEIFIANITPDSTQRAQAYAYLHGKFGVGP